MPEMTTINARVSPQAKEQAAEVLASMGLSISDAVNALLNWVAKERHLPFETYAPNAESRAAIAEADKILSSHSARFHTASELFDDLEKNASR